MNWYADFVKPAADRMLSGFALLVLSPLLLTLTILLLIANRGNPVFIQPRPGKAGKIFRLLKFKTMNERRDENGELLPDAERLTPVGRIIRKTSLDELPQLWNVFRGDMSLIGPRPLLVSYLPLYTSRQARRHEVKPGITGWAQINGRNAISWEEKFELDVWYVDHLSIAVDVAIILRTISKVIKTEGVSQRGHATMPVFSGSLPIPEHAES